MKNVLEFSVPLILVIHDRRLKPVIFASVTLLHLMNFVLLNVPWLLRSIVLRLFFALTALSSSSQTVYSTAPAHGGLRKRRADDMTRPRYGFRLHRPLRVRPTNPNMARKPLPGSGTASNVTLPGVGAESTAKSMALSF
jgi:hypothetical protein